MHTCKCLMQHICIPFFFCNETIWRICFGWNLIFFHRKLIESWKDPWEVDEGGRFFKFFMRFWWHHPNNNILGVIKDYKETNFHAQVDHVTCIKGIVHTKMKILSSFTHPQVIPKLNAFLCSAEHKGRKFVTGCFGAPLTSIVGEINTMEVNGGPELLCFLHSSEYLPLCSPEQRHSYMFETTWG